MKLAALQQDWNKICNSQHIKSNPSRVTNYVTNRLKSERRK